MSFPCFGFALSDCALMIFHIAFVRRKSRMRSAFKNRKNALRHIAFFRVADDIRQNIEPPAMRHSHINFFNAAFRSVFDQLIEQRNNRFACLRAKSVFDRDIFYAETARTVRLRSVFAEVLCGFPASSGSVSTNCWRICSRIHCFSSLL